jgi:succinate dehydrogenase/fumarate reductase flavoprotein subunit
MADRFDCDLLVVGAGMAGLSAGARAAEAGARVLVVEKAPQPGGSALWSGGYLWTVPADWMMCCNNDGDPGLGRVVVEGYAGAIAWLRQRGVGMSPPIPVLHGRGYQVDVESHFKACLTTIESRGGHLVVGARVERLVQGSDGAVCGAHVQDPSGGVEVRAAATLLATGGYQGDPDLRAERIHPNARTIPLRSNPHSTGDGIRLGLQTGAVWASENPGFYGHLVCSPVRMDNPERWGSISQYQSDYSVLLNEAGLRFTDESRGDFYSTDMLVFEPHARGLLVWDAYVQAEHVVKPFVQGVPAEDKLDVALEHGALGARVLDLPALADVASRWGFDGPRAVQTIREYNRHAKESPERLAPPRAGNLRPMDEPPYYAMVVEPAITFTHGGLRVDESARVLDGARRPIPGLLAAGADVGDVYRFGYAGGLALAITFGLRAARTAGWGPQDPPWSS